MAHVQKKKKIVPTDIPIIWVNVVETVNDSAPFL